MGSLVFSEDAWKDYLHWQLTDRKKLKRINQLLRDVLRGGADGIGKPEQLRGDLSGFLSRRIDETNRLVYRMTESAVEIISCRYHYPKKGG